MFFVINKLARDVPMRQTFPVLTYGLLDLVNW